MTYGCRPEDQAAELAKWRRLVEATGLPVKVVARRGGGIGIEWTIRGRGDHHDQRRSEAHWALMDAGAVVGLKLPGCFASLCTECGASAVNYKHTPELCAGLVTVAAEWGCRAQVRLGDLPRVSSLVPGLGSARRAEEAPARALRTVRAGRGWRRLKNSCMLRDRVAELIQRGEL